MKRIIIVFVGLVWFLSSCANNLEKISLRILSQGKILGIELFGGIKNNLIQSTHLHL